MDLTIKIFYAVTGVWFFGLVAYDLFVSSGFVGASERMTKFGSKTFTLSFILHMLSDILLIVNGFYKN